MLSAGFDALTFAAAVVGGVFLAFISVAFMVVGRGQRDRSRKDARKRKAKQAKLISLLREQGYSIEDLLRHEYFASFTREDFSDP